MEYNFKDIEKKWQQRWAMEKTFATKNDSIKPKYYVLDMFPYPSGAGLHVGHPLGYIASDIVSRYKRHKGFNVLHPMGYDSFGLPAEQYAIQTGQHPKITTEQNIRRYREQFDKIGFSFDWDREIRTSEPEYYKWTQWIFIQIFNSWYNKKTDKAEKIETLIAEFEKNGNSSVKAVCEETKTFSAYDWKAFSEKEKSDLLMNYRIAYLGEAYVNWCPAMGTVLANDEVKDGVSERGGYPVERKLMKQWSMRITAYAQRLLDGLDKIDWTDSLKDSQRYWIGRSEGTSLEFKIQNSEFRIEVFTTRPDTIFGVSFVTLAPEHELVDKITKPEFKAKVDAYVVASKSRSERERQADVKKVSGEFTGAYVIHPFSGKQIPIYVGDYVLAGYGTGAVMAVPGHDERDHRFAKHFDLPILQVVEGKDVQEESYDAKEGKMMNSDFLNGLEVKAAIKKVIEEIEKKNLGKGKINFRLRDAVFGRQRYWGEPIPIYYKDGIPYAMPENELPLVLPEVDKYLPTEDGEPPLARAKDWKYKGKYEYEQTTMPGWAGSSWYYLRYMDAHNEKAFVDKKQIDYWQNIDLYLGGSEHATGHLLYVRFWTMFLKDMGYVNFDEPAKKLINQGMIQGVSEKIYKVTATPEEIKRLSLKVEGTRTNQIPHWDSSTNKFTDKTEGVSSHVFISADIANDYKGASLTKRNVDISFTSDNRLDLRKYVKDLFLKKEIGIGEPICFVTRNGNEHVYSWNEPSFNEISIDKIKFLTSPEVEKMSKSKWNVVTPDDICEKFGADTLRLYEMFLGPLELSKPWNTNGITGVHGFLKKLWRLFYSQQPEQRDKSQETVSVSEEQPTKAELKTLHKTIKKITEDIERFSFNTSVSNFMICVNELTDLKCNKRAILEPLLVILSPYAPHVTEELWEKLGHKESIAFAPFPTFNEAYLVEDNFSYPISFNGKMRFNIELPLTLTVPEIESIVMKDAQTHKYLEGKIPKKVIIVPKKIVNIVV
jgi:leucyl-tRNA synthetase